MDRAISEVHTVPVQPDSLLIISAYYRILTTGGFFIPVPVVSYISKGISKTLLSLHFKHQHTEATKTYSILPL